MVTEEKVLPTDYIKRVRRLHRVYKALEPAGKIGIEDCPLDKEHDEAQLNLLKTYGAYMRLCERYPKVNSGQQSASKVPK